MATKIVTKNSSTASAVPTAAQLVQGELAVNVADKRLFTEDNGGSIVELGTNPSTLTVTGEITANGGIALGDNGKATFGAGDDLQIFHDGSNSYVHDNGTGRLFLKANDGVWIRGNNNSTLGKFTQGGAVTLYHNNSEKLATTSTGIDVTGTATMDGLVVEKENLSDLKTWSNSDLGSIDFYQAASYPSANNYGRVLDINSGSGNSNGGSTIRLLTAEGNFEGRQRLSIANNGDISFYEDTGTTAKLFWDASAESLGIGTDSPDTVLSIRDSADKAVITQTNTANGQKLEMGNAFSLYTGGNGGASAIASDSVLAFATANTERMRIDSSGNLLVGKTSASSATIGFQVGQDGFIAATRASGQPLVLNRTTTDGVIADFRKDGAPVGSIGVAASDNLYIGGSATDHTGLVFPDNAILPAKELAAIDAFVDLGTTSRRFKDLYLSGGVKSTSSIYMGRTDLNTSLWIGNSTVNAGTSDGNARDNAVDLGYSGSRWKDLYLSGGVYLGGTGAANKLDDYETGTWTPTAQLYSGTMTVNSATYTKIGNLVTLRASVSFDATTDNSGVSIQNVPFAHTGANKANGGYVTASTVATASKISGTGSGTFNLKDASGSGVTYTAMAGSTLDFVLIYEAA